MSTFSSQPVGHPIAQCVSHDHRKIRFEVKEKRTHKPVRGATITLTGPAKVAPKQTGKNGQAVFEHLPAGDYSVTATAADYLFLPEHGVGPTSDHHTLIAIRKPAELQIHVALEGGAPLPGAAVRLHVTRRGSGHALAVTKADDRCNFAVKLRDGHYHLELTAALIAEFGPSGVDLRPYYHPDIKGEVEVEVQSRRIRLLGPHANHPHPFTLVVPAFGALSVTLSGDGPIPTYQPSPYPLEHVEITLTPESRDHHAKPIRLASNGAGVARFDRIPPGHYRVALDPNTSAGRGAHGDRSYYRLSHPKSVLVEPAYKGPARLAVTATRRALKDLCKNIGARGNFPDSLLAAGQEILKREFHAAVAYTAWATTCDDGRNPSPQTLGDLKFGFDSPNSGGYVDNRADLVLEFAGQNGLAANATPLLWFYDKTKIMPAWCDRYPGVARGDKAVIHELVANQIQRVMTHYSDPGIESWVVVNEPLNLRRPNNISRSSPRPFWKPFLPTSHGDPRITPAAKALMAHAFRCAHKWSGGAHLIMNDYTPLEHSYFDTGHDAGNVEFFDLLRAVRHEAGVPVAAGFQFHMPIPASVSAKSESEQRAASREAAHKVRTAFERYRHEGIPVYITELGFSPHDTSQRSKEAQRIAYHELLTVAGPLCEAVYLWGVTDAQPGSPDINDPYLFDSNLLPKLEWT